MEIRVKDKTKRKTDIKTISDDTDIIDFNKELKKYKFEDVEELKVKSFNHDVDVKLKDQKILVDNKEIDLELPEKLSKIRWINFKRHRVSYRMTGGVSKDYTIGTGFQGTDSKGNNVQRIMMIDKNNHIELKKKK